MFFFKRNSLNLEFDLLPITIFPFKSFLLFTILKIKEPVNTKISQIPPFLLIIWAYNWSAGGVDMYCCLFSSGYIFDLIGALGAFVTLYILVKQCYNRNSFLWRSIHFWGRYSLIIYCVHSVEHSAALWKTIVPHLNIPLDNLTLLSIFARMSFVFLLTLLLLKIRPVREYVFQIKKCRN